MKNMGLKICAKIVDVILAFLLVKTVKGQLVWSKKRFNDGEMEWCFDYVYCRLYGINIGLEWKRGYGPHPTVRRLHLGNVTLSSHSALMHHDGSRDPMIRIDDKLFDELYGIMIHREMFTPNIVTLKVTA